MSDDKQQVDALLRTMREKAEAERAELARSAEERAREILDAADREAERIRENALSGLDREVRLAIAGRMGAARMETQKQAALKKRELVDSVFAAVEREVMAIDGKRYEQLVSALIREALSVIPNGGTITVRTEDLGVAKKATTGSSFEITAIDAESGTVTVSDRSGMRRVDNGLRVRLERARTALADEVGRRLFGHGAEHVS